MDSKHKYYERGCLNGRKYKITLKPFYKLAIDLDMTPAFILQEAGIIDDCNDKVSWEYTADNIEKLCDYLGVHPSKLFSFELK